MARKTHEPACTSQKLASRNDGDHSEGAMGKSSTDKEVEELKVEGEGQVEESAYFFWDQEEAKQKQVEQIGASACGATAILNVMVRK